MSTEMKTFIEEWEVVLDDLETQSSLLLVSSSLIDILMLFEWLNCILHMFFSFHLCFGRQIDF